MSPPQLQQATRTLPGRTRYLPDHLKLQKVVGFMMMTNHFPCLPLHLCLIVQLYSGLPISSSLELTEIFPWICMSFRSKNKRWNHFISVIPLGFIYILYFTSSLHLHANAVMEPGAEWQAIESELHNTITYYANEVAEDKEVGWGG